MKWLRECFAEYARHPLPAFIGLAIIAASLVTAAMAFIRRHAGSEPSAPLAGTGQNAQPAAPAPRGRHHRRQPRHRSCSCQRHSRKRPPSRRQRNTRGPVTARTFNRGNTVPARTLTAGTTTARAIRFGLGSRNPQRAPSAAAQPEPLTSDAAGQRACQGSGRPAAWRSP
jgi:hypothetical protein